MSLAQKSYRPPPGCPLGERGAGIWRGLLEAACNSRPASGLRVAADIFATFLEWVYLMEKPPSLEFSLDALRRGDRREFARLVDAYSGPIYHLGLRMLGNPQDAEDVLQNTFLKALTHMAEFEGRSSLSTWLYRIAANEALMLIRRKKPEVNFEDDEADDSEEDLVPLHFIDWSHLPEERLLSDEGRRATERAIEALPENLRMVFVLRDVEGLSIKETAEALHLSEANVKTRLLRARLRLREQLSEYFGKRLIREEKNEQCCSR